LAAVLVGSVFVGSTAKIIHHLVTKREDINNYDLILRFKKNNNEWSWNWSGIANSLSHDYTHCVSIVGDYNSGKTWLLNKLLKIRKASLFDVGLAKFKGETKQTGEIGSIVHTKGLSVVYDRDLCYIDSEGLQEPGILSFEDADTTTECNNYQLSIISILSNTIVIVTDKFTTQFQKDVVNILKQVEKTKKNKDPFVKQKQECADGVELEYPAGLKMLVADHPHLNLPPQILVPTSYMTADDFFSFVQFIYFLIREANRFTQMTQETEEPILSLLSRFCIVKTKDDGLIDVWSVMTLEPCLIPVAVMHTVMLDDTCRVYGLAILLNSAGFSVYYNDITKNVKRTEAWIKKNIFHCNRKDSWNSQLRLDSQCSIVIDRLGDACIIDWILQSLIVLWRDYRYVLRDFHLSDKVLEALDKKSKEANWSNGNILESYFTWEKSRTIDDAKGDQEER